MRTAAIEECCDPRMTFWQVVNESAEGCEGKQHALGEGESWSENEVGKLAR